MEISANEEVQNKIISVWTQIKNTAKHNLNYNENKKIDHDFTEKLTRKAEMLTNENAAQLGLDWQHVPNSYNPSNLNNFGYSTQPTESNFARWDSYPGVIQVHESVNWLFFNKDEKINKVILEQMSNNNFSNWIEIGERKSDIATEIKYCDPEALKKVLEAKGIFDELDSFDLVKARSRANPFEAIKSVFFMNRAALKMANIDAATGFLFTGIDRQEEHKQSVRPYYFADICAGPGSFSEYVFWRKKWAFKGFGMTLRGEHDFRLYESSCAPSETFEAFYGVRDDGNVYYPENIQDFCAKIKTQTNGEGVHFVMGDGGFSVEGQENMQEILSKQLYTCQCFIALSALRTYGHFVVKLFDLFTEYSVGLIFLMYLCFNKVAVFKPNASRPANSERYLICCKKKPDEEIKVVRMYLEKIVYTFLEIRNNPTKVHLDINGIVPESFIKSNVPFVDYMINSNNSLAKKQTAALMKLGLFCRDSALIEPRQEELRKQSLAYWQIPDKPRKPWSKLTVQKLLTSTVRNPKDILNFNTKTIVKTEELKDIFENPENWNYTFVTSSATCKLFTIYVGLGLDRVYKYFHNRWVKVEGMVLIRGTILYAELVTEYRSEKGNKNLTKESLHVIDAIRLGDLSLADLPYSDRKELINIYCQAINKESRTDLCTIRSNTLLPLNNFSPANLTDFTENGEYLYTITSTDESEKCKFLAKSLLLLRTDSGQHISDTISSGKLINVPNIFDIETKNNNYYLWNCIMQISKK